MATLARAQTVAMQQPRFRLRISRVLFLTIAAIFTAVALAPL